MAPTVRAHLSMENRAQVFGRLGHACDLKEADEAVEEIIASKLLKVMEVVLNPDPNKVNDSTWSAVAKKTGRGNLNLRAMCISASRSESAVLPVLSATDARYLRLLIRGAV